jgi:nucleoside-diphosphate-sugar epimerase
MMQAPITLIIGAGSLGQRIAHNLVTDGDEVLVVRRRDQAIQGARLLRADIATGEGLKQLPQQVQRILFAVAPDQRDEASYRALYLDGLRRVLDRCSAQRVVFISSTAVYAQDHGEWLDEQSEAQPVQFNGRVLRECEQYLELFTNTACSLRLSGLYGPERRQGLNRLASLQYAGLHWTNRIHIDDAASAAVHLLQRAEIKPVYIGTDDRPSQEFELLNWWRAQQGENSVTPSADSVVTGKRLRNALLRHSGWSPRFPSFVEGYRSLLAQTGV